MLFLISGTQTDMKQLTISAALLSIVLINTIGSEDAGAFDAGAYHCSRKCWNACERTRAEYDWFGCHQKCKHLPDECPPTVKAQGRVKTGGSPSPNSTLTICEKAKQARARNSPAAPGLEAKCAAAEAAAAAAVGTGTTDR